MQMNLSENDVSTVLSALEFYAEDREYLAEKDPWTTETERPDYEDAAKEIRELIERIEKQCADGNKAITG